MSVPRITPDVAAERLRDGWKYVDVRSVLEFERGHPEGAYNLPLMHAIPGRGMSPNPEFAAVAKAAFDPGDRLVVGCASGNRSQRASETLISLGFSEVADVRGGFVGERAPTGLVTCEGWASRGLPVAKAAAEGRSWAELRAHASMDPGSH